MRGIAAVDDVEDTAGSSFSGARRGGAPFCGAPGYFADVVDVDCIDAKVFGPEPFHFRVEFLVDAGEAEAPGKEADVVFAVHVRQAQYHISQSLPLCYFFQSLFSGEFPLCDFCPWFG